MKAPANHTTSLADFWDDGPSHKDTDSNDNNSRSSNKDKNSSNVTDLLNWISNVQIKRRKFRRRYRCSHLLAEAVLSSTLRQARTDLAIKQEEKRKKAQEFSYQLNIKFSQINEEITPKKYYGSQDNEYQSDKLELSKESCRKDEHVQACISSLDNFFSELKSIKV